MCRFGVELSVILLLWKMELNKFPKNPSLLLLLLRVLSIALKSGLVIDCLTIIFVMSLTTEFAKVSSFWETATAGRNQIGNSVGRVVHRVGKGFFDVGCGESFNRCEYGTSDVTISACG